VSYKTVRGLTSIVPPPSSFPYHWSCGKSYPQTAEGWSLPFVLWSADENQRSEQVRQPADLVRFPRAGSMLDQVMMPSSLHPHLVPDLPHASKLVVTREDEQFLWFLHHLVLVWVPRFINLPGEVPVVFDDIGQGIRCQDLLQETSIFKEYFIWRMRERRFFRYGSRCSRFNPEFGWKWLALYWD